MIRHILAATAFALAALNAAPALADQNDVRRCVDECLAWYDTPSYELKQCIAQCQKLFDLEKDPSAVRTDVPADAQN